MAQPSRATGSGTSCRTSLRRYNLVGERRGCRTYASAYSGGDVYMWPSLRPLACLGIGLAGDNRSFCPRTFGPSFAGFLLAAAPAQYSRRSPGTGRARLCAAWPIPTT
jgi:hypothetical protein